VDSVDPSLAVLAGRQRKKWLFILAGDINITDIKGFVSRYRIYLLMINHVRSFANLFTPIDWPI
jgi:hypothetical protein